MRHLYFILKLSFIILIVFPCFVFAQQPHLPIRNYTVKDFKIEGQNWSILQDKRGIMYFSTNYGVFEFDGQNWDVISKANRLYYMGLAMDSAGRIYVGMSGDFGYIAPDNNGKSEFYSLTNDLNEKDKNFDLIKRIFIIGKDVFFCNPTKIFKWSDGRINVYDLAHPAGSFSSVNGILYWREKENGLMKMENGEPKLLKGGEQFANERVNGILPYDNRKLLLITETKGLYIYDGSSFSSVKSSADKLIRENSITKAEKLENGNILLNTEFNGTFVLDGKLNLKRHFNKGNGLCDDNVWFSYPDKEDNLWLALNSVGISKIAYNSPISMYDETDGINSYVQSIVRHKGLLYVGTGKGVLYLSDEDNNVDQDHNFKKVENLNAVTNNLISIKGDLLAATFAGVYQIIGNKATKIGDGSFRYFFISHSDSTIVFVGGDEGLIALRKINGKWTIARQFKEVTEGIMKIADVSSDEHGPLKKTQLWLGCINNGLLKLTFDNGFLSGSTKVEKYDTLKGIPEGSNTDILQMNGHNVFISNSTLLKFDFSGNQFIPNKILGEKFINRKAGIISLCDISKDKVWINYVEEKRSVSKLAIAQRLANGDFLLDSIPFLGIDIGTIWQIYPDENGITWFCGEHGLLRYDSKISKNYKTDFSALVRKVTVHGDSTLFYGNYYKERLINNIRQRVASLTQPKEMMPALSYENNSFTFNCASTTFENENSTAYKYFLEGYDKSWSPWKSETKAVYTNLWEGNYKFHVIAKNKYGHESSEGLYEFTILPPWYRTSAAYFSYTLLFAGVFYGGIKLNSRRLTAANVTLQKTINNATLEIRKQKEQIEDKNKDITDSIRYAKRLQTAILKPEGKLGSYFADGFIFFRPKDIVSGDFYWFEKFGDLTLVAAADCTGHGVPGAFMSIIGCNLLSQTVNEHAITKPAAILNSVNKGLSKVLQQRSEEASVKDGMDIALCVFNSETMMLEYSGAFNPMWLIRDGKLIEYKADKFPVGAFIDNEVRIFTNHEMPVQKGDVVYLFSDGYPDQFGGPDGKKFKYKALQKLILENYSKPASEQKKIFENVFLAWMGKLEQVDDVLLLSVKI